jgi:hypothetical protein
MAILTYSGKKQKKNTKMFKETQINIAFRNRNNAKHGKTPPTYRQIRKKWCVQNEMYGLPTKIHGETIRPFYNTNIKSTYRQYE